MKKLVLLFALAFAFALFPHASQAQNQELQRWEQQAHNVTIVRDDWGVAHVYGKTDADAVFGMIYAQAEDDFNRVEMNYVNSIGRLAEAEGESAVWRDLRMKIFIDPAAMKIQYDASPAWLKSLMNAWADGLNFYLFPARSTSPASSVPRIRAFHGFLIPNMTFAIGSMDLVTNVKLRTLQSPVDTVVACIAIRTSLSFGVGASTSLS